MWRIPPRGELFIACPICNQSDPKCGYCKGTNGGLVSIGCPFDVMDQVTWDVIAAQRTLENGGGWPGGIGWANEPAALVDAVNWVRGEVDKIKAELAKPSK